MNEKLKLRLRDLPLGSLDSQKYKKIASFSSSLSSGVGTDRIFMFFETRVRGYRRILPTPTSVSLSLALSLSLSLSFLDVMEPLAYQMVFTVP
jgi:hypothetical protein